LWPSGLMDQDATWYWGRPRLPVEQYAGCRVAWIKQVKFILSGILIYPAVWPQQTWVENWEGCAPFRGEGSHRIQCGPGPGLPSCQVSSWSIQTFGHYTSTLQTDRQDRSGQITVR